MKINKTFTVSSPYFYKEDIKNILKKTEDILSGNQMLTMSKNVKEFENKFKKYCDTKYAIATSSCTSALEISLSSLDLKADDEVIVPVQTFIATGSAVLKAGAKIIFCDVDQNFLLDFKCLKNLITKKTKAVIIVHFAGLISENIVKIKNFLKKQNIYLIEDAAHSHGATFGKFNAGNIGDFGCFSFYSTKIMTTGEGGMITVNSKNKYEKCSSIRNRGMNINLKEELFVNLGSNYRVTEFQALLGLYQLKRLEKFVDHRNKIANIYKNGLSDFIKNKIIRIQETPKNSRHAYWRFIIFLEEHDREKIKKKLNLINIKVDSPYFPLLHKQPLFKNYRRFNCSNAEKISQKHICLPVHMNINKKDAEFIIEKLGGCLNH